MNRRILSLCLIVACGLTACRHVPDERRHVAVYVNGEPILHRDVEAEANRWIDASKARDAAKGLIFEESSRAITRDILRRDVLEALIERKLIAQQLKTDQIEITEEEIDSELKARAARKGQSVEQAEQGIAAEGKNMAAVREKLRWHTIGVEKLYAIHAENKKSLTEAEALAMYNEYPGEFDQEEKRRVSHILVRVPPDASESAKNKVREKANRILNRLNAGESFAALARQFSDDELSRDRGGDRGFSGRGIIRGPGDDSFGDAAFAMKRIGEISDVVETSDGFHIILLTDLRPARRLAFAEVKDRIIEDFRHREIGQFWEEFGGELRARANLDWTSYELFRQAKARRRQEIHNAKIERMIAREQEKAMDAGQAASPQANDHPQPQQRTDIR